MVFPPNPHFFLLLSSYLYGCTSADLSVLCRCVGHIGHYSLLLMKKSLRSCMEEILYITVTCLFSVCYPPDEFLVK